VADDSEQCLKTTARSLRHTRLLGLLAWVLFALAPTAAAGAAALAHNRVQVLILVGGLVMTDLAVAIVISVMWFVARHYIEPLGENRIENEYCYRAGYRDATLRFLQPGPGLQLVRPPIPAPPRHIPAQSQRGHYAAKRSGGG
jgi:hypothetical protein